MRTLVNPKDSFQMNWIENEIEWGTVRSIEGLSVKKGRKIGENIIKEQYVFTNETNREIFVREGDVAVYTPFVDKYDSADVCMKERCHTHIWCGGEVSYVCALRMSGIGPHLGLYLTKGSLSGYRYERDLTKQSNDRGTLSLLMAPTVIEPGESYSLEWVIFWHKGKQDFYKKLENFSTYVRVEAERYVVFQGETIRIRMKAMQDLKEEDILIEKYVTSHESVCADRKEGYAGKADFVMKNGVVCIDEVAGTPGEYEYRITAGGIHTVCRILVSIHWKYLLENRCRFIAANQQYHKEGSHLDGAYLIYDNENQSLFYNQRYDYNGGRERICMGILLARYLQTNMDEKLASSLSDYLSYVTREMVDQRTGEVFNDVCRDNSFVRLYNNPWFARFYMEIYKLSKNREFLKLVVRILEYYYRNGGTEFYALEVPITELVECLEKEGMTPELALLLDFWKEHGEYLLKTGVHYPASEVNYEQSIVGPAANDLLELYKLTKEEKYLEAAEEQIQILEQFQARQPDYHLNETAIRHWDGYWFGKRQMYGDTYPHYWSAISGIVYKKYAMILEELGSEEDKLGARQYRRRAEASIRGPLSLFYSDGSASCAYVYPYEVNDRKGRYADPYANDQDWALYFLLRDMSE